MYKLFRPNVRKNRTILPKTLAYSWIHDLKHTISLGIVLQCSFYHCTVEVLHHLSCYLFPSFLICVIIAGMFYNTITVTQTSLYQARNWNATFPSVSCMLCCGALPVMPSWKFALTWVTSFVPSQQCRCHPLPIFLSLIMRLVWLLDRNSWDLLVYCVFLFVSIWIKRTKFWKMAEFPQSHYSMEHGMELVAPIPSFVCVGGGQGVVQLRYISCFYLMVETKLAFKLSVLLAKFGQDAVCQSHTGHMTELWFLPARPLKLNTNEWIRTCVSWSSWVHFVLLSNGGHRTSFQSFCPFS